MAKLEIQGRCDPRFKRVRELFEAGFESGAELGAGLNVVVDGRELIDLWGGFADRERTRPWRRDTLANVYSTTKGITAIAAHQLVERGELELDAPVARYWPEFAQKGKASIPVRMLLNHRAGLAAVTRPLAPADLFDWATMTRALEEQEPWWKPGADHGYHALTYGWLVGELIRRVSGMSVGRYVREHVAAPLGAEFWIGLPEELDARTAELHQGPISTDGPNLMQRMAAEPNGVLAKAFGNPPLLLMSPNTRAWRAAELPAANGHTTAPALARIYAALASGGELDGVRILRRDTIERAREEESYGPDRVLALVSRFGLGFMLPPENEPLGPNPRTFGHGGAGGSLGLADPETKVGFGYVMNLMHTGAWLADPRPRALLDALYEGL
ncbi:MAG: beta-lactamase family protein [Deltaproteobacteria bacterium]|nr:beta-lactamase family protein [Deltaproteobacteria bacterium]